METSSEALPEVPADNPSRTPWFLVAALELIVLLAGSWLVFWVMR